MSKHLSWCDLLGEPKHSILWTPDLGSFLAQSCRQWWQAQQGQAATASMWTQHQSKPGTEEQILNLVIPHLSRLTEVILHYYKMICLFPHHTAALQAVLLWLQLPGSSWNMQAPSLDWPDSIWLSFEFLQINMPLPGDFRLFIARPQNSS